MSCYAMLLQHRFKFNNLGYWWIRQFFHGSAPHERRASRLLICVHSGRERIATGNGASSGSLTDPEACLTTTSGLWGFQAG